MDSNELLAKSITTFDGLVQGIKTEDWQKDTACTDWNVRQLVNHVTAELLWAPDLAAGKTIADVGDKYDGDVLGEDPVAIWRKASTEAQAALAAEGALERTVHLSFGDFSAKNYLEQLAADVSIHACDLAAGLGQAVELDPALIQNAIDTFGDYANRSGTDGGPFGPAVESAATASPQQKMLNLFGRKA